MKKKNGLMISLLLILLVACLTPPMFAIESTPSMEEQEITKLTREEIALTIPPGIYSKDLVVDLVWEQYQNAQTEIATVKAEDKKAAEEAVKIAVVPLLAKISVYEKEQKTDRFLKGFCTYGLPIIVCAAFAGGVWLGVSAGG